MYCPSNEQGSWEEPPLAATGGLAVVHWYTLVDEFDDDCSIDLSHCLFDGVERHQMVSWDSSTPESGPSAPQIFCAKCGLYQL